MKLEFSFGSRVLCLPYDGVADNLKNATENDLRVLLALALNSGNLNDLSAEELAETAGLSLSETDSAVSFWRGCGIISTDGKKSDAKKKNGVSSKKPPRHDDIPQYSGEDIEKLTEKGEFAAMLDECQNITGKLFNPLEINKIAALYDYLGLSAEQILLIFTYCKNKGKKSVHYIEKTAYNLYDEGVDTLPKLEAYLKRKEENEKLTSKLRSLFGFGERALTAREGAFIKCWSEEWGYDYEIIKKAYEITVSSTTGNTLSLPYLSKILSNWHQAGYKTLEDIEAALDKRNKDNDFSASSFDVDEFFDLARKKRLEN